MKKIIFERTLKNLPQNIFFKSFCSYFVEYKFCRMVHFYVNSRFSFRRFWHNGFKFKSVFHVLFF
jgi:hypothetical protein